MQITTVHTLAFTTKCAGNDQQVAALAIIKTGAANLGLTIQINNAPLLDGEDTMTRQSNVTAWCGDFDLCEFYWHEVSRALKLIGVEATSP